ncbi:MAG: urease accessory protein UreF [Oscillatoriales cyanobacterium]|nr:MAG: urease accessory protein UreF [Oscillatoriales cyanobacterium]
MSTTITHEAARSLALLQLASPALPVGSFSYSEAIESLVEAGRVRSAADLADWLRQELRVGSIRLEAVALVKAREAIDQGNSAAIHDWNQWISALRETEEFRLQSWQMGRSLVTLAKDLQPPDETLVQLRLEPVNYAIAFASLAAHWHLTPAEMLTAYLQSWVSNLVSAGVRSIPIGQTQGQQTLLNLWPDVAEAIAEIQELATAETDQDWFACGWGLSIASMTHETQYSRLFRS